MADSHDPVKDAVKNLFGWGKKEEHQEQQDHKDQSPVEQVTQQAAALADQSAAQSSPVVDTAPPTEASSTFSNPYGNAAEPAAATPANPYGDSSAWVNMTPSSPLAESTPAVEAAPAAAAEEHPSRESQAVSHDEPAPAPVAFNPDVESINGHAVGYSFLRYYKEHPEIGQPVDDQHGDVGGYQMFENAILHWDGSNVQAEKRGSQGGGQAQASAQRTYTVNSGDNLTAIAQQVYGDGSQWQRIFEANRDKISNPDLIHPGQQLIIP